MSRRSTGPIATWAEIQRRQQRQAEAQQRARVQQQREAERRQRAAERDAARTRREQQAEYRRGREADAARRTDELTARAAELAGVLRGSCAVPAVAPGDLLMSEALEPFSPGALAVPVPMPRLEQYVVPQAHTGWGGRRAQEAAARAQFEHDLYAARAAEEQRGRQLAAYQEQYRRWAEQRLATVREHNARVHERLAAVRRGEPAAVEEYVTAALYASRAWPAGLPRQVTASYEAPERRLSLTWELPGFDVVPEVAAVRYMPTADRDKDVARPAGERRAAYRDLLAQILLLVLRGVFAADDFGLVECAALDGFVDGTDPATGHRQPICLASVWAGREAFEAVRLERVDAVECLVGALGGRLSARPDRPTAVEPVRPPGASARTAAVAVRSGAAAAQGDGDEPDLLAMDPLEFEELIAELFRAMGMQAVTTVRSGDGGVDVDAYDPDPIRGGTIVVQVKRYRNTVSPSAVRDLYGTVQSIGANKGVLVTTSRFGRTSHAFAEGKPLTLVSGTDLVGLLHAHGLAGQLGPGAVARTDSGADSGAGSGADSAADSGAESGVSVLGLWWAGAVRLDVCALVCRGGQALGDEHLVFYNNPATPDGTVRIVPPPGEDKAALAVAFERLPAEADRLVLVAAVDPAADPDADLAGFTGARIRLLDAAGAESGRLDVNDGRPGETALVLGSFRRRTGDDWTFVPGGRGYPGPTALSALLHDHGIESS